MERCILERHDAAAHNAAAHNAAASPQNYFILDNLRHQGIISRVTGLGGIHPAHGIKARQVKIVTCPRSQLLEVLDFGDSKMITKNISAG